MTANAAPERPGEPFIHVGPDNIPLPCVDAGLHKRWQDYADALRDLLAERDSEIESLRKDAAWQPIETAPKDGRCILLISGSWLVTGAWHRMWNCWANNGPVYSALQPDEQPTHWMPLPKPPAALAARED